MSRPRSVVVERYERQRNGASRCTKACRTGAHAGLAGDTVKWKDAARSAGDVRVTVLERESG